MGVLRLSEGRGTRWRSRHAFPPTRPARQLHSARRPPCAPSLRSSFPGPRKSTRGTHSHGNYPPSLCTFFGNFFTKLLNIPSFKYFVFRWTHRLPVRKRAFSHGLTSEFYVEHDPWSGSAVGQATHSGGALRIGTSVRQTPSRRCHSQVHLRAEYTAQLGLPKLHKGS